MSITSKYSITDTLMRCLAILILLLTVFSTVLVAQSSTNLTPAQVAQQGNTAAAWVQQQNAQATALGAQNVANNTKPIYDYWQVDLVAVVIIVLMIAWMAYKNGSRSQKHKDYVKSLEEKVLKKK
jgi:hypothetical protein